MLIKIPPFDRSLLKILSKGKADTILPLDYGNVTGVGRDEDVNM